MPVITVTLIEGYSEATRRRLEERLTDAACVTIGAPFEGITIVVSEVPAANYMRGRTARTPGTPPAQPAELVRAFLAAMEARDLEKARGFLAEGYSMTFPGGARFTRLEELVEWSKPRYRKVAKTYEAFDESLSDGAAVVHCHGTLSGVWLDGTEFAGIRFIDRFTVKDGKLADQMVWNDMGEARAKGG